jgi:iron complex transport system permease protein
MRSALIFAVAALTLVAVAVLGLALGHGDLASGNGAVFLELRAWRIAAAALAGAALGMGGVLMQGLFRNPLASPDLLGTTAFALLGGQVVLVMLVLVGGELPGWLAGELLVPVGCLLGAAAALAALLWLAERASGLTTVLVVGFLLAALGASAGTLLTSLCRDRWELMRALQGLSLGGVDGTGPAQLALGAPLVFIAGMCAWGWGRALDVLLSGEQEAAALGVDVALVRRWALVWTATLTAAAVALGGAAVFVGLIVPHVMRSLIGVTHRRLLPACALGGAVFLVACDNLARALPTAGELPLGVVTGLIGAPLFIVVLLRSRRELA